MEHLRVVVSDRGYDEAVLSNPLSKEDREEIQWYFESFPEDDFFAVSRSDSAVDLLRKVIHSLSAFVLQNLRNLQQRLVEGCVLAVDIIADGTANSLHDLMWELIERPACWLTAKPGCVSVSRFIEPALSSLTIAKALDSDSVNILVVSARPDLAHDTSYLAISKIIMRVIKHFRKNNPKVNVVFARPGTWDAFCTTLHNHGKGYFSLAHFDVHGSVGSKHGEETSFLHFSPNTPSQRKPDRIECSLIAEKLCYYKIPNVVLNACRSAFCGSSQKSNLAASFVSQGIANVVAMSYYTTVDCVRMFMTRLYVGLFLSKRSFRQALAETRSVLRKNGFRQACVTTGVWLSDDGIPVLYQHTSSLDRHPVPLLGWPFAVSAGHTESMCQNSTAAPAPLCVAIRGATLRHAGRGEEANRCQKAEQSLFEISPSRDLDILSLEIILDTRRLVLVRGDAGSGKTTLAESLRDWWEESGYAGRVSLLRPAVSIEAGRHGNLAAIIKELCGKGEQPGTRTMWTRFRTIILVDDLLSMGFYSFFDSSLVVQQKLEDNLQVLMDIPDDCRLLIFATSVPRLSKALLPNVILYEMQVPFVNEAVNIAQTYLALDKTDYHLYDFDIDALGYIAVAHDMNIVFLKSFMPLMAQRNLRPSQLTYIIGDILGDSGPFENQDFLPYLTADSPASSGYSFLKLCRQLRNETPLAYLMLLSLAPFQGYIPADLRLWITKLVRKNFLQPEELFEGSPQDHSKLQDFHDQVICEALKSDDYTDEYRVSQWFEHPFFQRLLVLWQKVERALTQLGYLAAGPRPAEISGGYLKVHPMLPYLLQKELGQQRLISHRTARLALERAFWEFYEGRTRYLLDELHLGFSYPSPWDDVLKYEQLNILYAIRISTRQPIFHYRAMQTYLLLDCVNGCKTPPLLLDMWTQLLDEVLRHFGTAPELEQYLSEIPKKCLPEVVDDPTMVRSGQLESAMMVAYQRGKLLQSLSRNGEVLTNASRARELFALLSKSNSERVVLRSGDSEAFWYAIQCQEAAAVQTWSSETLDLFAHLLETDVPQTGIVIRPQLVPQYRALLTLEIWSASRLGQVMKPFSCKFDVIKEIPQDHRLARILPNKIQEMQNFFNSEGNQLVDRMPLFSDGIPALFQFMDALASSDRTVLAESLNYFSRFLTQNQFHNVHNAQFAGCLTAHQITQEPPESSGLNSEYLMEALMDRKTMTRQYEEACRSGNMPAQMQSLRFLAGLSERANDFYATEQIFNRLWHIEYSQTVLGQISEDTRSYEAACRWAELSYLATDVAKKLQAECCVDHLYVMAEHYAHLAEDYFQFSTLPQAGHWLCLSLCSMSFAESYWTTERPWRREQHAVQVYRLALRTATFEYVEEFQPWTACLGREFTRDILFDWSQMFHPVTWRYLIRPIENFGIRFHGDKPEQPFIDRSALENTIAQFAGWAAEDVRDWFECVAGALGRPRNIWSVDPNFLLFLDEAKHVLLDPEADTRELKWWHKVPGVGKWQSSYPGATPFTFSRRLLFQSRCVDWRLVSKSMLQLSISVFIYYKIATVVSSFAWSGMRRLGSIFCSYFG